MLEAIRRPGRRPVPPLNLVADFGGGGLLAVCGILAGLLAEGRSGRGQVVDVATVDGVALFSAGMRMLSALGSRNDSPGSNVFDEGSPFCDAFATSERRFVAAGAIACVSPVLTFDEAADDEHNRFRGSPVEVDGLVQSTPAPRFSDTPGSIERPPPHPGEHAAEILADWLGPPPAGSAT